MHRSCQNTTVRVLAIAAVFLATFSIVSNPRLYAQAGSQGTITVSVVDPTGDVVPEADLTLIDVSTNDAHKAATQSAGTYTFVGLNVGTYSLTVAHPGFAPSEFKAVVVHAGVVTDVKAILKVAAVNETVVVTTEAAPLLESTSNVIGGIIDMKQIEELPLGGRDLTQLSTYVPGYTGTWDGLPGGAQGNNIDGVIAQSSRFKDFGIAKDVTTVTVSPRVEDIQEMTIQTDQIDLNQGFGQASMQVNYVTRRGSNKFHGRLYDDYQGSALNANSWFNNAQTPVTPKGKYHINDFGVSVGGPIIKDKLFFFGSYSEFKQPGLITPFPTNNVLVPAAQAGNFTYTDTNGKQQTVNVLQIAGNAGLNSTIDSVTANDLKNINAGLSLGQLSGTSDPNIQTIVWSQANPISQYYPTVRLDYNISEKFRLNWAFNETKITTPSNIAADFPGPAFKYQIQGNKSTAYTTSLGFDWTLRPTLINEFRGGFLYNYSSSSYNAGNSYQQGKNVLWQMPGMPLFASGDSVVTAQSNFYPLFNLSDTMTWQHGKHTVSFGGSWYREQDHYWNPPIGYPWICLGLAGGDPALNAFTNTPTGTVPNASSFSLGEAEQLYAVLAGRVTCANGNYPVNPQTKQWMRFGAVNLDELQQAWGLFYQDSFRLRPNLTLNYGLRWDFTGDDHDLNGVYHGILNPADLFGPSGYWNEFNPGSLQGTADPQYAASGHQYNPWHVSPQPSIGIAWSPHFENNFLHAVVGKDSVIRAGYSLRRFTPAYQSFWSYASNYGSFFYAGFVRNPSVNPGPGNFTPGSLKLQDWQNFDTIAPPIVSPPAYTDTFPESGATFVGPGLAGMNPNIHQPYIQSWNLGLQRKFGTSNVLEVRYVGNRGTHLWLGTNINEVNIFENGFLTQFKAAQKNLAINNASGNPNLQNSFGYNGLVGQQKMPIFQAAFAGEGAGTDGNFSDYSAGNFIQLLQTGQAGAMAQQLATPFGAAPYFCNLVGASFNPCSNPNNSVNYTGAGAGYPINFFQTNPYQSGSGVGYLNSIGYSTYNSLQVDWRQNQWHGMQFDANYTWSHNLGLGNPNGNDATYPQYTVRDLRLNYGPAQFDLRHTVNVTGTYDLPFGKGEAYLNRGGALTRIVGGWTAGTIFNFQTGYPLRLLGGFSTFNNVGDGGIALNGVTMSQLQSAVQVSRAKDPQSGATLPFMTFLNSKYLANSAGGASSAFISPNTTPGTFGLIPYLYGPHRFNTDLSITKRVPIHEQINFTFQTEFLNAFNHTNFAFGDNNSGSSANFPGVQVQSPSFGTLGPSNGPRQIELRANIEF